MTNAGQKRKNAGFTLVEIIIVIAILGILAMIAIPRYSGYTSAAKDSVDNANARTLTKIAHAIEAKTESFPLTLAEFNVPGEHLSKTIVPVNPENSFSYDSSTGTVTVVNTGGGESEPPEEPEDPDDPPEDTTAADIQSVNNAVTELSLSGGTSISLPNSGSDDTIVNWIASVGGAIASVSSNQITLTNIPNNSFTSISSIITATVTKGEATSTVQFKITVTRTANGANGITRTVEKLN
jgi:type IV pilus assembly protein PilA